MPQKSLWISTRPTRPSLALSPVCDFRSCSSPDLAHSHRCWGIKKNLFYFFNHLGPPTQTAPPSLLSALAPAPPAPPHGPPSWAPSLPPPPAPSQRSRRPSLLRRCPPARTCPAPRSMSGPRSASTGTPGPSSVGPPAASTQTWTPTRRRVHPPSWRIWPRGYPPPPHGRVSG